MRLEESDQAGEKRRIGRAAAQLVCLDSGQGKEPLRAAFVRDRRRERGKSESIGVVWRLERHRLDNHPNG